MDLPDLKHFGNGWIYSDPVNAVVGESVVPAIYTDRGWYCPDFMIKLTAVTAWSDGKEADQSPEESGQSNERVQSRPTAQRKAGQRKGSSSKKPSAGDCDRSV